MEKLMIEALNELMERSIPELEEIKIAWVSDMKNKELSNDVVKFCTAMIDVIIEEKREKEGIIA